MKLTLVRSLVGGTLTGFTLTGRPENGEELSPALVVGQPDKLRDALRDQTDLTGEFPVDISGVESVSIEPISGSTTAGTWFQVQTGSRSDLQQSAEGIETLAPGS